MKLSRITTDLSDGYIVNLGRAPVNLADVIARAERHVRFLRDDAYYAYLDGRTARAKALNKEADRVAKAIRSVER